MRLTTLLAILCLALSAPAFADMYNNGPTNGTSTAFVSSFWFSDAFGVSISANMTNFTFAEWVPSGAIPLTVGWFIGTSPFTHDLGWGDSSISASLLCSYGQPFNGGTCGGGVGLPYDVYNSTVDIGSVHLVPGQTYWLSLRGETDNVSGSDGWDVNSGPSLAYWSGYGAVPSESFTINGNVGTTPEPGSVLLFGTGIVGLAGFLRRRMNK